MIEVVRILVAAGVGKNASAIWRYLQLTSTAITFLRDSANSSADNKASEVNLQTALARVEDTIEVEGVSDVYL